ncbi:hypothetical protein D3C71_1244700 [compost metagenome]
MPKHTARRRHDPAGRHHIAQRQPAHARQWVPRAGDGADQLLRQRLITQVLLVVLLVQAAHHDVELALLQPLQQHGAGFNIERNAQAGVLLLDQRHGGGQQAQTR